MSENHSVRAAQRAGFVMDWADIWHHPDWPAYPASRETPDADAVRTALAMLALQSLRAGTAPIGNGRPTRGGSIGGGSIGTAISGALAAMLAACSRWAD
jgi:hypothetical protein